MILIHQLCNVIPRLSWYRYPEAVLTCVAQEDELFSDLFVPEIKIKQSYPNILITKHYLRVLLAHQYVHLQEKKKIYGKKFILSPVYPTSYAASSIKTKFFL